MLGDDSLDSERNLWLALLLSFIIVVVGTSGYMLIMGWSFLDSLYMTVITLSGVGFSEVHPLDNAGRIYTMVLIMFGLSVFMYVASTVVQFAVDGQIRAVLGRRRLDRKINLLKNHYIVCGYGRIGRVLCERIRHKPLDVVVIENNREMIALMEKDGMLYVSGDAGQEAVLIKAGVKRAKGLVAVLATDADNVFLVLTARQLNTDLNIIARASTREARKKLLAAGSNTVESPYEMGAATMAQRILRPTVTSFLDLALAYRHKHIQMEEISISASSELVGVMLKDSGIRQNYNLIIIAMKKSDGSMLFNPSFETTLDTGDTVIAVGDEENLQKLEKVLGSQIL